MANTVTIDTKSLTQPLPYKEWLKNVTNVYVTEQQAHKDYSEYITQWYKQKNNETNTHKSDVREMYLSFLKDITLNYTTAEERRFLLNIDFNNPRDLDIIIPFYSKKIKQITQYHVKKREEVVQSSFRNTLKGSDYGVELSIKKYILSLLTDEAFVSQFNIAKPDIEKISSKIVIQSEELYETQQAEYDLDPKVLETSPKELAANIEDIDPLLFIDLTKVILEDLRRCDTALATSSCLDPLKTKVSQSNDRIGVNIDLDDWSMLPLSSFVGGEKTYNNLIYHQQKNLIKKYMGTRYYYLSTGTTTTDYVSGVLFEPDGPHTNILNRYHPGHLTVSSNVKYETARQIGGFFTPSKMGVLTFASYNPSYVIDIGKLNPNQVYTFPDPDMYGSGRGLSQFDQASPIVHTENVLWAKYDRSNNAIMGDVADDEILPRFYAYQSREESTKYNPSGLSKRYDSVDFWKGDVKNIWANEDLYPTKPLQDLPIQERLGDLLISDHVVHEWRSDVFGNEFALYKNTHIPRMTVGQSQNNLHTPQPLLTTENVPITSQDWFSMPDTMFYSNHQIFTGNYLLTQFGRFDIRFTTTYNYKNYPDVNTVPNWAYSSNWIVNAADDITFDSSSNVKAGLFSEQSYNNFIFDAILHSPSSDDDHIALLPAYKHIPHNTADTESVTASADRVQYISFGLSNGGYGPGSGWGVTLNTGQSGTDALLLHTSMFGPSATPSTGWNGKTVRVKVQRQGNIITGWCSEWGDLTQNTLEKHALLPDSEISINLDNSTLYTKGLNVTTQITNPYLSGFKGSQQVGVLTDSQPSATLMDVNFYTGDSRYSTVYSSPATDITADKSLNDRKFNIQGTLYMRNIYSTQIEPVSSALSAVFLKYNDEPDILNEINNNIITFDIIKDVMFIETPNYLIIEKYKFDFNTEKFTSILSRKTNLSMLRSSIQDVVPVNY